MAFRSLARGAASSFTSTAPSSASRSSFAIASSSSAASASASSSSSSSPSSAARLFSSSARTNKHHLPPLPARISQGCAPLLSESTVKMLWNEHQQNLLDKLNDEVEGSDFQNSTLVHTIISTAAKPQEIRAFNYASLALNNAFFLSGIVSPPGIPQDLSDQSYINLPVSEPSTRLNSELSKAFGSVTQFKNAFTSAALGMSGSGYLWLVWDVTARKLGIVPTYGAGTILVQKRQQRGPAGFEAQASLTEEQIAKSSSSSDSTQETSNSDQPSQETEKGPLSSSSSRVPQETIDRISNVAQDSPSTYAESNQPRDRILTPVMCLSVNEHAWMNDWGVTGKQEYLVRFWDAIDWNRVESLMSK
ncbi:unnamed protein product [Sympodiomycopsis kandeliae]